MYEIKVDTHTHTVFSKHAYSTVEENARAAKEQGLEVLAITDHFSPLFVPSIDYVNYGNFWNMKNLPKNWFGVEMYYGAEVDIVSMKGDLFGRDLYVPPQWSKDKPSYLEWLKRKTEFLIGSIHQGLFAEGQSKAAVTQMYCNVIQSGQILILGHLGRDRHPFELKEVLNCAKENHVLIELNEISFSKEEYVNRIGHDLLLACAEMGVPVSVGSDAHCSYRVGKTEHVIREMEKVNFPKELIATAGKEQFQTLIDKRI